MNKMKNPNAKSDFFVIEVLNTLGQGFLLEDMVDQEELFDMQDKLAEIIVKYANRGNDVARIYTEKWTHVFKVDKV
jgi:hypothetical protein